MSSASEKLAALRERVAKPKGGHVEPVIKPGKEPKFTIFRWFEQIRANPTSDLIGKACAYYDAAITDGTHYVVPVGVLEDLLLQQPGLAFFYRGVLVDAQQSRRWMEARLDRLEAERHNYYMFSSESKDEYGSLKTTDAAKLAKGDPAVLEMSDNVRLLAFHEHNLERLMEAFENIKYVLNHVVTLRKEGLDPVWVDPTKETSNN